MLRRPKVGLGIIIVKGNKILMGKRVDGHGKGTWCFPGGDLEFNEDFKEAAKREVKEESDINIKNIKFSAITNDIFKKENKHYITIFMKADYKSGEIKINEPDKMVEFKWFEWEKLPTPLFLPEINLLKQGYNPFKNG